MDNGVNFTFDMAGHDFASFGLPLWQDGWHQVIITGSKPTPLADASKGGRLILEIKNVDPQSPDNGKPHLIGLNVYHNDPATKARAEAELASICFATGTFRFANTAELYNKPFYVLAQQQTSKPTPAYPNPTPQTNFRGYRNMQGQEPSKQGGGGQSSQAPQFAPQNGAPQFAPQAQQPQFAPQGQPQQQPQFQQPQQQPFQQQQPQNPAQQFQQPAQQPQFQQPAQQPAFQPPQGQPQQAFQPMQPQQPAQQPQQAWQPQGAPQQPQQQPQQFAQQPGGGQAPWGPQQ